MILVFVGVDARGPTVLFKPSNDIPPLKQMTVFVMCECKFNRKLSGNMQLLAVTLVNFF